MRRAPAGSFPACILLLPWPLSFFVGLAVAGVMLALWPVGIIIEWRRRWKR
jgi:hypothetical protein